VSQGFLPSRRPALIAKTTGDFALHPHCFRGTWGPPAACSRRSDSQRRTEGRLEHLPQRVRLASAGRAPASSGSSLNALGLLTCIKSVSFGGFALRARQAARKSGVAALWAGGCCGSARRSPARPLCSRTCVWVRPERVSALGNVWRFQPGTRGVHGVARAITPCFRAQRRVDLRQSDTARSEQHDQAHPTRGTCN
jgi:hypothetical protein